MKNLFTLSLMIFLSQFIYADGHLSPELECCIETNTKLQKQIENQKRVIKSLKDIEKCILLNNDTLKHTIKIELDNLVAKDEPIDTGCNICSIIGAIFGAVLSGGIAIFIFWKGRQNEKSMEKQKLVAFGEEIYTLTKNITTNAKKQNELLGKLVDSIREKPYTHGIYNRFSFNLLKRAQSFDTSYIFNTFKVLNLEKKSYIKFYSSIDFLLEVFISIDGDYHKNINEVITPLSNDFIKQREEIFRICTDYIEKKRRENDTTERLYVFINQLVMDYYSSENLPDTIDINYDIEILIRPLKVELLAKYRDYDIANEILNKAKRAGDIYQTIILENSSLANGISSQSESIISQIAKLEEIEMELNKNYAS